MTHRGINLLNWIALAGIAATIVCVAPHGAWSQANQRNDRDDKAERAEREDAGHDRRDEDDGSGDRDRHHRRRHDGDRDDDHRRGDERFGRGRPSPVTIEQRIEILKHVSPELGERVERFHEREPERVEGMLSKFWPGLGPLVSLRDREPELFELRVTDMRQSLHARKLMFVYHRAKKDGDEKKLEQTRAEMKDLFAKHFETRMKIREYELKQLEKRIADMREGLAKMRSHRDEYIQGQIKRATTSSRFGDRDRGDERRKDDQKDDDKSSDQ